MIHTKVAQCKTSLVSGTEEEEDAAWCEVFRKMTTSSTKMGLHGPAQQPLIPALTERNKLLVSLGPGDVL